MRKMLIAFVLMLGVALILFLLVEGYGVSVRIRSDTGELRYYFLGIRVKSERLPENIEKAILSITGNDPAIERKWYTCAVFPLKGSNNTHLMCQEFYVMTAAWIKVDPKIASFIMKDIIEYMKATNCQKGGPRCWPAFSPSILNFSGKEFKVIPDWREVGTMDKYLREKGLLKSGGTFDLSTSLPTKTTQPAK